MSEQYTRRPNAKCQVCGKAIYRRPGELKENKGRAFCSSACFGKISRKEVPCVVCGKAILAGQNKKTCSRACANAHRAGMKYEHNRPHDKVKRYQLLKGRLLELRGIKCERCNYSKAEILQIHHKNRNRDDNRLSNLELICPNCHYEEHHLSRKVKK